MDSTHIHSGTVAPTPSNRIGSGNARTTWIRLCLATVFALCLTAFANADTVSGRVYGPDAKPVINATLTAKPVQGEAVDFKTDGAGNFSVYLDPGRYTVNPIKDDTVQAVIDSFPQPVQQDIHLKKKGK
ncbi:MAG: carboxypeptidase-like regulatory domain-containing protein [Acidobacteriia bacterium]|nr:carboxypeptidase-like regulatory domain-containing protein [Terriglobia bacterium]